MKISYLPKAITWHREEIRLEILLLGLWEKGWIKSYKWLISDKRKVSESPITCLPPTHTQQNPWKRQIFILYTKYLKAEIGAVHEEKLNTSLASLQQRICQMELARWSWEKDKHDDLNIWQVASEWGKWHTRTRKFIQVNNNTRICSSTFFKRCQTSRASEKCGWGNKGREK